MPDSRACQVKVMIHALLMLHFVKPEVEHASAAIAWKTSSGSSATVQLESWQPLHCTQGNRKPKAEFRV